MALASFIVAAIASCRVLLIVLGIAGIGATLIVVPLHFFEAWRKVREVPNKEEYAWWVGFETVCACGFFLVVIYAVRS